ncbi:MAG: NAD-dependent epimerase/dehydratase [Flavobacteriaceae bacterium]|nr:NAD-dependent epimerase/dehydratase [Flavobacteriaceae bacterium]
MNLIHKKLTMKRKTLLIGGAGYIGLAITEKLLSLNEEVVICDNFIYKNESFFLPFLLRENLSFFNHDIRNSLPSDQMRDITDVVVLAGLVGDPITKKYPDFSKRINGNSIRKTLEDLDKFDLNKVIFISTCSNYGMIKSNELANEEFNVKPLSLYAEEKVKNENFILKNNFSYNSSVLRFATAFGLAPRMRFDLTVNEFAYSMFNGIDLEVYDPDTWRPYCHVKDFGNLISLVLKSENKLIKNQIFNAGGEKNNHTKRSIVEILREYMPNSKVSYSENGSDPRNYKVDFSKVKNILNFEPTYDLRKGIEELVVSFNQGFFKDVSSNKNEYGNYFIYAEFINE